jgi:hypothetical protein
MRFGEGLLFPSTWAYGEPDQDPPRYDAETEQYLDWVETLIPDTQARA